jgi:ferrous iron transport protein B
MATLYSVEEDDNSSLREQMRASVWPDGTPVYSLAAALSLMVFYVLAMQCMSTLVIVKRETGTWKWPTIQFFMMTGLAYVCSWVVYVVAK